MTNTNKAIAILEATQDGDMLSPSHLRLVETAVNNNLTDLGQKAFDDLFSQVQNGSYRKPWFHGIEHVSQDHNGYVYWKGKQIEHFSYGNQQDEKVGAEKFAERCRRLEASGYEVSLKNYLSDLC